VRRETTPGVERRRFVERVARWVRCDSTLSDDMLERIEAKLAHEPIENAEHAEPIDPIDANEPTEPIENDEPTDPIEQNELCDQRDQPVRFTSRSWVPACRPRGP
jgi:hypothetical protein